jgi:DNA-binding LacI/PurR family transcriptional regulator
MSIRKRPPTLRDVATLAGVSPFTVSAVLNGARSNSRVSPETRERIERHAQELNYVRNASARGLARRKMDMIGVFIGMVDSTTILRDPYSIGVLDGILLEAYQRQLAVTILPHQTINNDAKSLESYRDGRTDGIILVAPRLDNQAMKHLEKIDFPSVLVAYPGEAYHLSSVDVDNAMGINLVLDHLLANGHTRIAHLAGNSDMASAIIRKQAFLDRLTREGIAVPIEYIQVVSYSGDKTEPAMANLLALPSPPTAIVAGNDNIAVRAIQYAQEAGVCVPKSLSIIGFDDTVAASFCLPPLTTIQQPLGAIGREAVRLLVDSINQKPATSTLLAPSLIVRGTATYSSVD